MSTFNRQLPKAGMDHLAACANEFPWFRDLLMHWQPAGGGERVGRPSLRLAIRNGYMNFYRLGQSVAKVSFRRDGTPQAHIHCKYISGKAERDQRYIRLHAGQLTSTKDGNLGTYEGAAMLARWIANAETHRGHEKLFVDDILTANPNIVDLEMGLPAVAKGESAPRMDIVALEAVGTAWRIVFWEAKLMADGRLRRSGEQAPEVVRQLGDYTSWMAISGHTARVVEAYRENCRLLVALHALAKDIGADIAPLGSGIAAVANTPTELGLDVKPRLLIENLKSDDSWIENGHASKLHGLSIPMHPVKSPSDYVLPVTA